MRLSLTVTFLFLLSISNFSFAEEDKDLKEAIEGSCSKIKESCQNSEFMKAAGKKKSLYKDCLQPLLNGQTIPGIKVDPEDIKNCNAKKAELKTKK